MSMSMADDAHKTAAAMPDIKKPLDRRRGADVPTRAEHLVGLPGRNWNAFKLAAQLKSVLAAIADHVRTKNGLVNGTEPIVTRGHLDRRLEAVLTEIGAGSPSQRIADGLERENRANRQTWIPQIVWRAAPLHSGELWRSADPAPTSEVDASVVVRFPASQSQMAAGGAVRAGVGIRDQLRKLVDDLDDNTVKLELLAVIDTLDDAFLPALLAYMRVHSRLSSRMGCPSQ